MKNSLLVKIIQAKEKQDWELCKNLTKDFFKTIPKESEAIIFDNVPIHEKLFTAKFWFDILLNTKLGEESPADSNIQRLYTKVYHYLLDNCSTECRNELNRLMLDLFPELMPDYFTENSQALISVKKVSAALKMSETEIINSFQSHMKSSDNVYKLNQNEPILSKIFNSIN